MNSPRSARASSASRASAKPTASKPLANAWARLASGISADIALPAAAIGRDAGVGQPQPFGRRAGLVEHVDRDAAARVPIAAEAQPARRQCRDEAARNRERAILVERG